MRQKHLICVLVAVLGLAALSHATFSRVESMGKSDDFFMDDISIFTNPANINLYANFLTGELGQVGAWESFQDMAHDPAGQWFGGAASYKLGDGSKVTLGLAFNRDDNLVTKLRAYGSKTITVNFDSGDGSSRWTDNRLVVGQFAYRDTLNRSRWILTPTGEQDTLRLSDSIITFDMVLSGDPADSAAVENWPIWALPPYDTISQIVYANTIPVPVGKTEFFLGYSNGRDLHIGGHFYMASQDSGLREDEDNQASSRVYRGDVGVNYGLGNHSIELSMGVADVSYKLMPPVNNITEIVDAFKNEESEKAIFANLRVFYDVPQINSKLVPVFKYASSKVNTYDESSFEGGLGLNKEIEKGIFYAGINAQRRSVEDSRDQIDWSSPEDGLFTTDTVSNTAKVSFGIEKNIGWKWFIIRVGGQKVVAQQTVTKNFADGSSDETIKKWVTNADDDGTSQDVIGFGVGFNFGNKLRVDGTINENFPYQNPFGYLGDVGKRLATRVSATYSF